MLLISYLLQILVSYLLCLAITVILVSCFPITNLPQLPNGFISSILQNFQNLQSSNHDKNQITNSKLPITNYHLRYMVQSISTKHFFQLNYNSTFSPKISSQHDQNHFFPMKNRLALSY
ncbi:hypothetical protein EF405_13925 [Cyclobacteriaceae bacterium YHN15]|nr:hypothetical protein EF405_13925 [Cyclobacteriaceae bacterium YHN15]